MTVPAAIPPNEDERIAALRGYAILDTGSDPCLDRIVKLAARQFDVAIALVSLVDVDRQWFKAKCGLDVDETNRDIAFCSHAILDDDVFVIHDAKQDPRFANNPLVTGSPHIRFYAGAPLITPEGHKLGALCLIDSQPRSDFSLDEQTLLQELAAIAVDQIEMRYAAQDVFALAESQKTVREKQSELELILNNVPLRIFYKDDKNRILRLNKAAAQSMDMSIEDAEGADTYALFPEFAKKYHEDDLEVINSGKPKLGIIEQYAPLGKEPNWVRTDKIPYTDPNTGDQFVFVIASDITAEQEAEEALRASEERYRSLYNDTPVMMHSSDRAGRLISVSDYWLEKFGYDRDEVIGRRSTDFLTEDSARKAIKEVLPVFDKNGSTKDIEFQIVTKGGAVLDVLISATAERDSDGKIIRTMAVLTDITDRREVERQFAQAQKMESVGQLTGGLAHDFNNLLAVIQGNLELIGPSIKNDEKTVKRTAAALSAVDKGAELTRRLLAFSRRQMLETTSIEPNPMIENLGDILRRTLGEEIVLECELGDNIPCVRTDISQLESAILNLAVNARDAMPHGGKLTIRSHLTHLDEGSIQHEDEVSPGEFVVISVSDTGEGIPAEEIEKVFEPFFTTKEVGKGSGLGLSMVYGLVKQTGGNVRIDSVVGEGTTVELYLPVDAGVELPKNSELPYNSAELEGTEVLLIVEDQQEVREMAASMLDGFGYTVFCAANGWNAVEMLKSHPEIDLLFTDMVMPEGMNGKELAQVARTLRPNLPVMFTTGYVDAKILQDGAINPHQNLLIKPYRKEDLARRVRSTLDKHGTNSPKQSVATS